MLLTYTAPLEDKVREYYVTLTLTMTFTGLINPSGLNLGMCDAVALAKAISVHIKSQDTQLLPNYSANRRARAIRVVELASSSISTLIRLMDSTLLRWWMVRHILNRVGFLKPHVL